MLKAKTSKFYFNLNEMDSTLTASRHLIFFVTFFCSLSLSASEESSNTVITGRVVDRQDNPLEHVQVIIESSNRGDVTNENGEFLITGLPAGKYNIRFQLLGYEPLRKVGVILNSQKTVQLNISLKPTIIELADILVTASRNLEEVHDIPQFVSVINSREIRERNTQQTPELLREEPGLVVQKTNQGGGSPIMRGFKANKLLFLVDGIRLNSSTYRGGNIQYLNSVDSETLERVEIVHGPISVMYGSDALGGAINLITKSPRLTLDGRHTFGGSVSASISTADETKTTHFNLRTANSKWGLIFEGSFKSFGDITRGSNGGNTLMRRLRNDSRTNRVLNKKQSPNGYDAYDLSSKVRVKLSDLQDLTLALQLNRQNSVPRYDVVETLSDSIRLFDPQERDLFYLTYTNKNPTRWFNKFTSTVSLHRQFERRRRIKFGSTTETLDQFRTLTSGVQMHFNKLLWNNHQFVYGAELYHDNVATKSTGRNSTIDKETERTPIFPDGSSFLTFGLFAQDAFHILAKWKLILGARFSATKLKAPFENSPGVSQFGTIEQSTSSLTSSLGSQIQISDEVGFVANFAQGFRTPNLDDVSKLGPGKGSSFFDVPNADIKPEKSLSIDAGFKIFSTQVLANVFGFYNSITDLLVRKPTTFDGSPFVIEEGDTLVVFHKENAGKAYTTGIAMNAELSITPHLAFLGNISYTYGQNTSDGEPLSGIPPFGGLVGLRWRKNHYWAELNSRFAAEQTRLALEDKEDLRIAEAGTPGWYTLNFRFGANVTKAFNFKISVTNILDQNYREHLSGFNAPGRNFIFSAQLTK
ncbi:MAG: TonB-dependent receptor domain-containing protein [bacterium]